MACVPDVGAPRESSAAEHIRCRAFRNPEPLVEQHESGTVSIVRSRRRGGVVLDRGRQVLQSTTAGGSYDEGIR